jgi:hypothetical protein
MIDACQHSNCQTRSTSTLISSTSSGKTTRDARPKLCLNRTRQLASSSTWQASFHLRNDFGCTDMLSDAANTELMPICRGNVAAPQVAGSKDLATSTSSEDAHHRHHQPVYRRNHCQLPTKYDRVTATIPVQTIVPIS